MDKLPEYCFLWIQWWPLCMQKSEWASWVQAIFSVLAIAAAIWLGRRSEREATRGAIKHYILFKVAVRDSLAAAHNAALQHQRNDVQYAEVRIHDAIALGHDVPLNLLPELDALQATMFRTVAAQAGTVLHRVLTAPDATCDFAHVKEEIDQMIKRLDDIERPHVSYP